MDEDDDPGPIAGSTSHSDISFVPGSRREGKKLIAFTYNLKPKNIKRDDPLAEFYAEFDTDETVNGIKDAIIASGYDVLMIEANEEAYDKLKLHRNDIAIVFNFAEAVSNGLDREAHIPTILEILKIPYTGPSPLSAGLILNKARAKEIWQVHGVPTAPFQVFYSENDKLKRGLKFPLIVKPVSEGSSAGIRDKSVVKNKKELIQRVREILQDFREPALVEQFLGGREFTVGLIGNGESLEALPLVEVNFNSFPEGVNKIDSYEAKWIWDDPTNPIDAIFCPAKVDEALKNKIINIAKKAFTTIGCRDWARIDIRCDMDNNPYVLELNCPVGLLPDPKENSRLPRAAKEAGIEFPMLIKKIIKTALSRYGI